jgi:hypothetical protein
MSGSSRIPPDSVVTTAKLADGAVTSGKIADSAVTSAKLADGTIVNADISPSAAISRSKIEGLASDIRILSSGTTNGWKWRKYSNGRYHATGMFSGSVTMSALATLEGTVRTHRGSLAIPALPSGFAIPDSVAGTLNGWDNISSGTTLQDVSVSSVIYNSSNKSAYIHTQDVQATAAAFTMTVWVTVTLEGTYT